MSTSIIIPVYNRYDLVHELLYNLRNHMPLDKEIEVVVMDDNSPDEDVRKGLGWWQKSGISLHPLKYHRNETNLGFGQNCNRGVGFAKTDNIILISTDVRVMGNFFPKLDAMLTEHPDALIGAEVIDWDSGWNTLTVNGMKSIVPYANGWFLSCKKSTWDKLGGFDPIYGRLDYEDVDISTTAHHLKIPVLSLSSPFLKHIGGATISNLPNFDRTAQTLKNGELWRKKWENVF